MGWVLGGPVIHGSNAVAELKLLRHQQLQARKDGHPRQQRRGRIEASITTRGGTSPARVIHGSNAVAELKRHGAALAVVDYRVIHGSNAVAELKHFWSF